MISRVLSVVFVLFLNAKSLYAAQSTITEAEGSACMGDDKSRKQTEDSALTDAKKNAVEFASTYIKTETEVRYIEPLKAYKVYLRKKNPKSETEILRIFVAAKKSNHS